MHLMQKCIFATRTFYEVKCSASHFPLENVQLCKNAVFFALQKTKMRTFCFALQKCIFASNAFLHQQNVTNAFDAKMHLMRTFCFALQKCIFASNAFLHQQNVTNAFDAKMHFGVHFPKENVQRTFSKGKCSATLCKNAFLHHILRSKMFSITFYKGKCSASHFTKENVQHQQNVRAAQKTPNTAFLHVKNITLLFHKNVQKHYSIKSTPIYTGGHLKWPPLRLLILASILGLRTIEK